ncbi:MAG: hypothetical protein F9K23_07515 [Bacteroidetes bacterium]|nr:MAG: hypothetical protein F9K23_07515 [Bacteroidota bacterium]
MRERGQRLAGRGKEEITRSIRCFEATTAKKIVMLSDINNLREFFKNLKEARKPDNGHELLSMWLGDYTEFTDTYETGAVILFFTSIQSNLIIEFWFYNNELQTIKIDFSAIDKTKTTLLVNHNIDELKLNKLIDYSFYSKQELTIESRDPNAFQVTLNSKYISILFNIDYNDCVKIHYLYIRMVEW